MLPVIRLIRPAQWIKNAFVFLPMFFGGAIADASCWRESIVAFFAFCFAGSGVYCLNDIRDVDADRNHPVKRMRPIASGEISVGTASAVMAVMFALSAAMLFLLDESKLAGGLAIIVGYTAINVAYSLGLKNFAIVDVFIIALGFVLRVALGGVACGIELSPWIVTMTFLLALFMAFGKRRDDVMIACRTGAEVRKSSSRYNLDYLNLILGMLGGVTIVCYVIYTVSPDVIERIGCRYVYVTAIFVLAGIMRYLQLAIVDQKTGSPTKIIYRDRFIQACVAAWILTFVVLLYAKRFL